ncbi:MAG: hypothetical protein CSB13_07355 [Chloroflexi bacterium]|nr:MAG: hypothetical protein CSB13_07355 [Chloroflexota bacterium]
MNTINSIQKTAVAAIPAACGELVQGTWQGRPCLVSCPIDQYSTATVTVSRAKLRAQQQPQFLKANQALLAGLAWLGREQSHGRFSIDTAIPRSRGYGSSTADIGAVLYALAQACERPLPPNQASLLATQIESTDSTLFSGLAMFDPINGHLIESFPETPPLIVIVIDPGKVVDPIKYHKQDYQNTLKELAPTHQIAFAFLKQGLLFRDWEMVGRASTLSATAQQKIVFNPFLDKTLKFAKSVSALGICRTHCGSVLGLLLDPVKVDVNAIYQYARSHLPAQAKISITSLVAGGPRYGMLSKEYTVSQKPQKHGVLSVGANAYKQQSS